jgi:hypothetical protein
MNVYKYPFEVDDRVRIEFPIGYKILLVEHQQRAGDCIWALVDPKAERKTELFIITGTGQPVPEHVNHIASWQSGPFVWHMWRPEE